MRRVRSQTNELVLRRMRQRSAKFRISPRKGFHSYTTSKSEALGQTFVLIFPENVPAACDARGVNPVVVRCRHETD